MEEYIEEEQRESFYDYYVREIEPVAVKYEFQRNQFMKSYFINVFKIVICMSVSIFLINRYQLQISDLGLDPVGLIVGVFILGALILFCSYWVKFNSWVKNIFNEVIPKLLEYLGVEKLSNPHEKTRFVETYLNSLELRQKYDFITVKNYLKKQYKGTIVNIVEMELIKGCGRGKKIVFQGLFVFFENPKEQEAEIVIKQNKNLIEKAFEYNVLELLKINNEEFERIYDVYTNNPQVAKKILNFKFIAKLLRLKKKNNYQSLILSFEKNAIHLMIGCKTELFKISTVKKTYDYEQYKIMVSNIQNIFKAIDELELI